MVLPTKYYGKFYVDSFEKPLSAMAVIGDFCFFAGLPNEELVLFKPKEFMKNFIIMVPQNEKWAELITNSYGDKAKMVIRHSIKKRIIYSTR